MTEQKRKLGFEIAPTNYIIYSRYNPKTKNWDLPMVNSRRDRTYWPSPMSAGLNYGRSVFEGMKAFRHKSGEIFIFRPQDHARRFSQSANGLSMPPFPEDKFLKALQLLVDYSAEFVPQYREGSLYIRPIMWADDRLGFADHPDLSYTTAFWCSPVGNYYTEGLKPISVYVMREMTRAMPGGLGYCKASGNYEISMAAKVIAEENGCNDALFLDGKTKRHIEELGAANVFMVKNKVLYTPLLKDTVLPGITRKSIMAIAESLLNLKVCEKNVTVKELKNADEVFASGTAAVVTPIGKIKDRDEEFIIGDGKVGEITKKLYDLLTGIQYGDVPDHFGWLEKVKL